MGGDQTRPRNSSFLATRSCSCSCSCLLFISLSLSLCLFIYLPSPHTPHPSPDSTSTGHDQEEKVHHLARVPPPRGQAHARGRRALPKGPRRGGETVSAQLHVADHRGEHVVHAARDWPRVQPPHAQGRRDERDGQGEGPCDGYFFLVFVSWGEGMDGWIDGSMDGSMDGSRIIRSLWGRWRVDRRETYSSCHAKLQAKPRSRDQTYENRTSSASALAASAFGRRATISSATRTITVEMFLREHDKIRADIEKRSERGGGDKKVATKAARTTAKARRAIKVSVCVHVGGTGRGE